MITRRYTEEELDRIRHHKKQDFDLIRSFAVENIYLLDEYSDQFNQYGLSKQYLTYKYIMPNSKTEIPSDKAIAEKMGLTLYQLDSIKFRALWKLERLYKGKVYAEQSLLDDLFPREWHEAIRDEADKCEMTIREYIKTCVWMELKQPRLRVTDKGRDL